MNEEQKQRMTHELGQWNAAMKSSCSVSDLLAISTRMAALLQDLIDAPEPEQPNQSEQHLEMVNTPAPSVPELEEYDAGALNDFGGGNVGWWQDYIRSELGRAYEFYCGQLSAAPTPAPSVPDGWQPIETAPKDNKRSLFLARFNDDGTMQAFDYDGTWQSERESWELPQVYYYWATALGKVEEPTHWMYEPEWFSKLNSAQQPAPPADLDAPEFSDGCEKEGFPGGCERMGCCKQLPATANPARTGSSQIEPPADLARDAERYRWLRNWTRRAYGIDSNPAFILPHVPIPTGPDQNIMRGSLAQHLDNAIDAAIERDKKGDQS